MGLSGPIIFDKAVHHPFMLNIPKLKPEAAQKPVWIHIASLSVPSIETLWPEMPFAGRLFRTAEPKYICMIA